MTKLALVKVQQLLTEKQWPVSIWLLVHDEIVYEVETEWLKHNEPAMLEIKKVMETALPLIVPMECTISYEAAWGEKKDIEFTVDDLDLEYAA